MMKRTGSMPGYQLRTGDVILENGRAYRVARIPVPELLDCGSVQWHVAAVAIEYDPEYPAFRNVGFVKLDNSEWLVQF